MAAKLLKIYIFLYVLSAFFFNISVASWSHRVRIGIDRGSSFYGDLHHDSKNGDTACGVPIGYCRLRIVSAGRSSCR